MERVTIYDAITTEKINSYADKIQFMTKKQVSKARSDIFLLICDDLLPKTSLWPEKYRIMFFKKPLGDEDTATMFWFLLGKYYIIKLWNSMKLLKKPFISYL